MIMAYQMSEESKQKKRAYFKRWQQENKEKRKAQARRRYEENPERHRNYALKSYYKHIDENRAKMRERGRIRYKLQKDEVYKIHYKSHCKLRGEVLTHYGKGQLACVGCGENSLACLTIDHVEGNGAAERSKLPKYQRSGVAFYRWLKKNSFPKGYQTLCMNCQWIKRAKNKEWN